MNELGTLQLPPQSSTIAPQVDALYYFIFWGSAAFFALIVGLAFFFIVKYRRREGDVARPSAHHNLPLEITWTIVPLALLMVVFVWGFDTYMDMHIAPGHSLEYQVTGKQWLWQVGHPNGEVAVNEMVVPVNQPVKVILQSEDVIHSFYVPEFRIKMDCMPNQYTTTWFEATRTGEFDLFCTEYCGTEHSGMIGKIRVLSAADFAKWEEETGGFDPERDDPVAFGEKLYASKACITCHSIDGSSKTGPSFKGIFGHEAEMADGSVVLVDENYIRESIVEPQAKIVKGYQPVMPTYTGILKPADLDCLIAFIKSLK